MEAYVPDNMRSKVKNMRIHTLSLRRLWEQKKTSNFLKDLDFAFTQREVILRRKYSFNFFNLKLEILQKSVTNLETFVLSKTRHYSSFLVHLQTKLSSLMSLLPSSSTLLPASPISMNELKERYFEKSKLVLKAILKEIEEIGMIENDSQMGLKSLEEEFKIKIKIMQDKWSFFNKRVQGEMERVDGMKEKKNS